MAKCVRIVGQGVPVRMMDDEAAKLIPQDGEYCGKSFWRSWWKEQESKIGQYSDQLKYRMEEYGQSK